MTQYYANADANGNILGLYNDDVWDVAKIPTTAIKITQTQWQDAIANQGKYIIQAGTLVLAPAPTAAQQLAATKKAKIAELQSARDAAIYSSFTSIALGTAKTYNYSREAAQNFRDEATMLSLDSTITSVDWYVIEDAKFITHTRDQIITVIKDGSTHDKSLKMKYFNLEAQVNAATTVTQVQAIVW